MTDLLDQMLAESGMTREDFDLAREKAAAEGKNFAPKVGVSHSAELARIIALPRRVWEEKGERLAAALTEYLRAPGGTQKLRPVQAAALQEAHDFGGLFGPIRVGAGKCVWENAEIYDVGTGRRRTLKELGPVVVSSMGSQGEISARSSVVFRSGEKPCVRVTLADGSSTVLSTDHPVFTHLGWVAAAKIPRGTLVAIPRSVPSPLVCTEASDDEVLLAAYLLSDGGVSQETASFTNGTEEVEREMREVATRVTGKTPRNHGPQYNEKLKRDAACNEYSVLGATAFRNKWGIHGLAKHKRLPAAFWGLPRRQVALFLNRFWACDGYILRNGFGTTLASEKLIDDLRFLLLRLGIRSRKHYRVAKCRGECFDAWRLTVSGSEVLPFAAAIGPVLGKEAACARLLDAHLATPRNTNVDVVPVDRKAAQLICAEMGWLGRGGDQKAKRARGFVGLRTAFSTALGATSGQWVGREQFARACERFGYRGQYAWLGTSDLAWEKATSVEPVGVLPVCDLTVPETGNFVCDNIVVHNTLISMLAFVVLEARRPVLLVPAKLVEKTRRDMAVLRKHWLIPAWVQVISYEMLGREQAAQRLEEAAPDVIVMDECHRVRNTRTAVCRRVKRYLDAQRESGAPVRIVAMSGTITKRSLHDYVHIAAWCLPQTNPTPRDFPTRMEWSLVLDERRGANESTKIAPGALIDLCNVEEREIYRRDPELAVRRAYRRRLVDTPGVVATQEGALGTSLSIASKILTVPELADPIRNLKLGWVRPDGEPIMDALELWRHLRALAACGMFYRWNPAPPPEWLAARKVWAKAVREILRASRGLDSESPIASALDRYAAQKAGLEPDTAGIILENDEALAALTAWREHKSAFTPTTEAVWLSDVQLKAAAKWMHEEKGICWVEHIEFGKRLAKETGVSYYWRGGVDANGRMVEDHPPGTPLIASIASNSEGRNLQAWNTNYIVSLPTTGAMLEQLFGRTHRDGQEADEVSVTCPIVVREQVKQFDGARADAMYITQTTGQEQKLCYADMDFVAFEDAPEGY